jgi:hypothetical protein
LLNLQEPDAVPSGNYVKRATPRLVSAAADSVWRQARGLKGDPRRGARGKRGRVLLGGKPIGDAQAAAVLLGLAPKYVYDALKRGSVQVRVPFTWERERPAAIRRDPKEKRMREAGKQVWTNRPGEHWLSIGEAARAVGRSRNAVSGAITGKSHSCAGRRWFTQPPEWARQADAGAARERAAAIRCNPGRFGKIHNGTDAVTGVVYVNGEPTARSQAERALAGLAKGAAA